MVNNQKRGRSASERQKQSIDSISKAVNELKGIIEEKKFGEGEDEKTVAQ